MVGTGSRLFFALAVLGLLGAGAYGVASGGDPVGVMSAGYKGGVGDHFGYSVLSAFGLTSLILGFLTVAIRDADPMPVAVSGGEAAVPEVAPPDGASFWPLIGALGLVITVLGLVEGAGLVALGLVLVAVTAIEWTVRAWSDRATGDPAVNRAIRDRLMAPVEVPIGAALVIAFVVLGVSRVLLAVSSFSAVMIAIVASFLIFAGAIVVWKSPKQGRKIATALLIIGAVAVIAGGIAGVAAGSRDFHEEEPGHEAAE
jgi:hypothetical protein